MIANVDQRNRIGGLEEECEGIGGELVPVEALYLQRYNSLIPSCLINNYAQERSWYWVCKKF